MAGDIEAQRAALKILWPEISVYCEQHNAPRRLLLTGLNGIPVDGRKLTERCTGMLLTRSELADQADVGYDMLTKIATGKRNPSAAALVRLLRVLECRPADLLLDN
jgi:Helix-turn-helix